MIIEVNRDDIAKVMRMLNRLDDRDKAMYRALKKTLGNTKTGTAREIRKSLNLKADRIKKDLKAIGPSKGSMDARLRCKSRPVGYTHFGARQTKKGVTVKVTKSGGRKLIPHAFIAELKSGNRHVAIRQTDMRGTSSPKPGINYARLPHKYRRPIKVLYGPRIADWLAKPEISGPVQAEAGENMIKNLDAAVMAILRGY